MKLRLAALAQRRAHVVAEIDRQRMQVRAGTAAIRQDLVYAGLSFLATRLLARRPWLRALALAALAVAVGSRLVGRR